MKRFPKLITAFALLGLLGACSSVDGWFEDDQAPFEGERISVLELQKTLEPDNAALEFQGLVTPDPWRNKFWPQVGGYPNHSMQNLALNEGALTEIWSVSIGDGSSGALPLTAQPIVVDGRVFTLDTDFNLAAFDVETGKRVWNTDVQDKNEDDSVISGGVSYGGGVLYATNGYNEVIALNPDNGEILWRKALPAPARAAPTVIDERVFVATLDNKLFALSAYDGEIFWTYEGIGETAGLIGAASPAANNQIVVPAFSSGELTALRVENGVVAWSDNLSSIRRFGGLTSLSDIKALPVIDQGMVFAISFSGRLVAIDERTGARIWQREIGGSNTPWIAGNHIFVLSSDNDLVALGRENGVIRWITKLPRYQDPEDRDDPIIWTGPVLAGGRLILAGTEGAIVEVNPETGDILNNWDTGSTIAIPPVVADSTLYLLSEDGKLSAYR